MVGHWFHAVNDFASTWLPLALFLILVLMAWLLWKTVGMMPRVKPADLSHGAKSQTTWADVDGVGAQRSGHGFNREQDQTLNQLLVELDGFEGAQQVVVMGASNRIQDLDPALLRPGRFDRQLLVPPPDLGGREAILRVHTRGKPLNLDDVDLGVVARQTSGLTGAELANICNEAAIKAGRRSASSITQSDFDWALERV